jgi:hypothetical protein
MQTKNFKPERLVEGEFDLELLGDSIPDLLPMTERAPGIHVSEIVNDIAIRLGHFVPFEDANTTMMQLGQTFEWALCERMIEDEPKQYCRIVEQELDGISGNLDLFDRLNWRPIEIKLTWNSLRWPPTDTKKFWKRWAQLAAYAKMMDSLEGELHVGYLNGDYKPPSPTYRRWLRRWKRKQLDGHWDMLRRHRDTMMKERELERKGRRV